MYERQISGDICVLLGGQACWSARGFSNFKRLAVRMRFIRSIQYVGPYYSSRPAGPAGPRRAAPAAAGPPIFLHPRAAARCKEKASGFEGFGPIFQFQQPWRFRNLHLLFDGIPLSRRLQLGEAQLAQDKVSSELSPARGTTVLGPGPGLHDLCKTGRVWARPLPWHLQESSCRPYLF